MGLEDLPGGDLVALKRGACGVDLQDLARRYGVALERDARRNRLRQVRDVGAELGGRVRVRPRARKEQRHPWAPF